MNTITGDGSILIAEGKYSGITKPWPCRITLHLEGLLLLQGGRLRAVCALATTVAAVQGAHGQHLRQPRAVRLRHIVDWQVSMDRDQPSCTWTRAESADGL